MTTVPPPPPEPMQVSPTTRQTSVLSVVSLIAGLTWWFWVGSVIAVITGHLARRECREQGRGGDVLAVFGLVLGYFGLSVLATIMVMAALGSVTG